MKEANGTPNRTDRFAGTTVAVTGAAGFFGGHLVSALLSAGAEVRALARYNSAGTAGHLQGLLDHDRLRVLFGDVRDPETLVPLVSDADMVFHLAALVSVPHSYLDVGGYEQTNIRGTLNVLNACRSAGVGRVVCVSSSEVYGTAQQERITERHPLVAQSPYAATKIAAEKLCESFFRSFDMPVVVARPFNLYGPRQSRRAVIPEIVAQALAGDTIRIGNVDAYRDFNYVADSVDALLGLGTATGVEGMVLNIGSERSTRVGEIVDMVGDLLGSGLTVETDESRLRPDASEVRRLCADASLLRELIGDWRRTPLDVGLARVITEMRARSNGRTNAAAQC